MLASRASVVSLNVPVVTPRLIGSPVNSDSSALPNNAGPTDHHDITNLVGEYRQRQLNLFRERQPELEPDEQVTAHLPTH